MAALATRRSRTCRWKSWTDLSIARGVPMAFRRFREWPRGAKHPQIRELGLPGEGAVVEPLQLLAADAVATSEAL